jgi:signal peptidase I
VIAVLIALSAVVIYASIYALRRRIAVVTVTGSSMRPTLDAGDRVLIRRAGTGQLRTGQVVVLETPRRGDADASSLLRWPPAPQRGWTIKRVAALPGELTPASIAPGEGGVADSPVPPGKLLVLGDNSSCSLDSRLLGYVDVDRVLGSMIRPMRTRSRSLAVPACPAVQLVGDLVGDPRDQVAGHLHTIDLAEVRANVPGRQPPWNTARRSPR